MEPAQKPRSAATIVRWIARILSIVSIGMLLLFFFGESDFSQPFHLTTQEWILVSFFPLGVMVGMILGWWREGLGGLITTLALLGFYLVDILFTGTPPGGPFFLLFASPGILFGLARLLSWKASSE